MPTVRNRGKGEVAGAAAAAPAHTPEAPIGVQGFIEEYRAWIVFIVILPLSFFLRQKERWGRYLFPCDGTHVTRVYAVVEAVRRWNTMDAAPPMCTDRNVAGSHSTVSGQKWSGNCLLAPIP